MLKLQEAEDWKTAFKFVNVKKKASQLVLEAHMNVEIYSIKITVVILKFIANRLR